MSRPVTLFTGQWADLPLEDMCRKASDFGYQGLELACWGDHFEVNKAAADPNYCSAKRDLLDRYDLQCHAISSHLVGQAVCDRIDAAASCDLAAARVGRRRSGGRQSPRGRGHEERGPGRSAARRRRGEWLHRLEHLAAVVFVPARARFDDRRGLPSNLPSGGIRFSTCSANAACGSRSKCTRPRSRSTSSRPAARSTRRQPRGVRLQLRPQPLVVAGRRPGRVHPRIPGPHLPRAYQGRDRHAQRPLAASWAATSTSATRGAAGTSARPAAAA